MSSHPPSGLLGQLGREADEGALTGRCALLPAGSIEHHGPHAPLGTDTFIARELARRVGARRPALLVVPELAYTPCPADTRRRRGTLALTSGLAVALFEELFRGLLGAGLRGVVVLNAHIGNVAPATFAADGVRDDFPDAIIALVSWWETLPAEETAQLGFSENGGHGHGGPLELSVTQAIVPGLVRPELSVDPRAREIDREKGRLLLELATDRLTAAVDELLSSA
jgi:creatinine amidohydrolase